MKRYELDEKYCTVPELGNVSCPGLSVVGTTETPFCPKLGWALEGERNEKGEWDPLRRAIRCKACHEVEAAVALILIKGKS